MIPPEEAPEYTSELKLLSPVSPKPVHYPVPSNIPVLENQIDPVFNQTGTHMAEAAHHQLPPPMYADQRAGAYDQSLHSQHQQQQQQQAVQHAQAQSNHPEAYMTQQAGQVGQGQAPQGHQAYHQAQEQASVGMNSQTNQVYGEKYSYQPASSGVVASSDASAHATASVPSDIPYPSTAAHHLPALPIHTNNEASFQSNSFHPQSQPTASAGANELPPGVEANSLQSLLNNFSQPTHSQAQSTSPSSQVAQSPPNAAASAHATQQDQAYSTYANKFQAQQAQQAQSQQQQQQQQNGEYASNNVGANGLPPPPVASFQQAMKLESQRERKQAAGEVLDEDDQPWTPETQHRYDNFLTEERKYVTEGNWEQFPYGSRLFVGNLSSERVTKRDIFHVFHKYGDLAQISIKQAYGFVQFLESKGCSKAISAEQGKTIRGKKIHLEVSKPQKNRNSDPRAPRRSRSPDTGRAGSSSVVQDRYLPGDRRAERDRDRDRDRTRDRRSRDYRPGRSPSPRSPRSPRIHRARDRSRDRYDARYRSRSRTPPYSGRASRFRSPSPRRRNSDDDLPLPRRAPRDVPDVQIIVLDDLDRNFIAWLEHSFTLQGIRVDVLLLSPRLSEAAVVRRQILEGVLAVSRITRINQQTAKIPLQIFDRRAGIENVRFDEYDNLDPTIAAQLVLRAKAAPAYAPPQPVPAPVQYGYGAGVTAAPNLSNLITSLDPTGLQKLLGVMQPPGIPTGPHPGLPPATALTPDLAKLLGNAAAIRPPPPLSSPGIQTPGIQSPPSFIHPPHPHQDPLAALRNNPALANLLAQQQQQQQSPQNIAAHLGVQTPDLRSPVQPQRQHGLPNGGQPDMADILAKLGSYRR
ncbi:hypothetical protein AUEXF2481DRAFT_31257 [Aureobasidium subglaciale EXF-2481]|uniref:RRM domain-containing protein n=1 Tax=Aureobasidium subglaciale (strain EXF-2481) TaxID=1043005 RepID=A0A074YCF7_AURSE|nr:uncharacterized protein AUEXF2481DRAFT_31257 [Aureobasidium subglaciale EXF-2481]KAI5212968.1 hypothetical protein E4T38_00001 [Aureobasidium subglaciale]KAI5232624.1 hypothetical protein E4T40_00001 [Aureobasidium subglaciale]KAI5234740.1 hypothetical protein E4T41_00001 [Aureobasidium subglaciale]KAI5268397.1 hypothetical protein E4T46_00001 [Aureobasidium subglaciale]KEQ93694.1 hypothetical protein AUEXF2481DRAFT_31257 [Aureobasidium subglaciale EXF-2481]